MRPSAEFNYDEALRAAISIKDDKIVELLINYGADINIFDGYCLIAALRLNNFRIFELLINAKINALFIENAFNFISEETDPRIIEVFSNILKIRFLVKNLILTSYQ